MKRCSFLTEADVATANSDLFSDQGAATAINPGATDSIMEQPQKVQVIQECDVCVLGGSCTGVFAAVRAAQMGAKVAIVEKQNAFGGVATAGFVNIWHRLDCKKGKQQVIAGLTEQVIKNLMTVNGCDKVTQKDNNYYRLNTEELKIELDRLVLDHAVTPYLHTFYTRPHIVNNQVDAVFIENKNGRQAIRARIFIDATGDGDLAAHAGVPFVIRDGVQPPTPCAKISGLKGNIMELMKEHGAEYDLPDDYGWGGPVPNSPDVQFCAYRHVYDIVASDANQLTRAEIEGRRQTRAFIDISRKYADANPCLIALAATIGIRETRSFSANYEITRDDILYCKRFDDAIANGTYPVDVHNPKTGRFMFQQIEGDFYQIPLASMVTSKAPNIILAGRTLCASREAFGAVRVMVNLNQTGEAAGVLAALAAADKQTVPAVKAALVRDKLASLGAVII